MTHRSSKNPSLYLIIPAYNEAANLPQVIADWYRIVEEYDGGGASRLVVIDDGSTDDTPKVLGELAQDRPLLQVISKENAGHGPALIIGYRYAVEQGADWIFQTDSDGQTDASEFAKFWKKAVRSADSDIADFDDRDENHLPREKCTPVNAVSALLGNRTSRGDGRGRAFVEKTLTRVLRAIFGVKVPDANAPFRLMRTDLVAKYLPLLPEDCDLPNALLAAFFVFYKEKVEFLPVTFRPRQGGENSINAKKILKTGRKAVRDFRAIRAKMPPR